MADEVPAQTRGEQRDLGLRFLHPALAEDQLPGFGHLADRLGIVRLRDGDEFDRFRRAARLARGDGNVFQHGGQALFHAIH